MAASNERVQDALAAYLDHLEMGGPEPDTSHLNASEKRELKELTEALELTEGVALDRGRGESLTARAEAATAEGEALLAQLRDALPPSVRMEADANTLVSHVGGIEIVDRWIVGTFGGRVRVWLLDEAAAQAIEGNVECLADLDRIFHMFPDMSAVALIGRDLSCLIVEPEDCAPQIQVPSGSLVSRRYKRAIQPAVEALPAFLDELTPYWEPMPGFDPDSGLRIDVSEIGDDFVRGAIEKQHGIGERARRGNPKKEALLGLGKKEITA
ncbi:MAG TPA: hypothetical protein VNP73_00215, partial [Actinomycetota bacterium]|nr:hypothetical protein [Actinomycetota bacterium]